MKFLVLLLVIGAVAAINSSNFTVFSVKPLKYSSRSPSVGEVFAASAEYFDAVTRPSNFGQLKIRTSPQFDDNTQLYAAGFAEGYVSAERIHQHYRNMWCMVDCDGNFPPELVNFFQEQDAWVRSQVLKHPDCPMWQYIASITHQLDGLQAGYLASEYGSANPLTAWAFQYLNGQGDILDVLPAVSASKRPDFLGMSYKDAQAYLTRIGHCSAFFKVTDDLTDILASHNTWFVYSAMNRIYKTYEFSLHNSAQHSSAVSFSSYPGTLASLDDFYMMADSSLIMAQTTNNIFNASLWDLVVPQSLFSWQRVRTACQLANSGPEWFDYVSRFNSGTYNNQYMVLDAKLFKSGSALQPNTLFVVEQIPGMVVGKDVTDELERGYWPSFNVPYHKEIYVASGYPALDAKGKVLPFTQYQQAPRAKIFRRDQSSVKDIPTLQTLMRSNNFQTDPYSGGSGWGAISARGDLDSPPYSAGGFDTKVTSVSMLRPSEVDGVTVQLRARIVNGPTAQGQKPFRWSTSGLKDSHIGQPDVFDFEFEDVAVSVSV